MKSKLDGNDPLRHRVDHLTSAVIEGCISSEEQEELARLLSTEENARLAFIKQLEVEAMLRGQEYRVGEATPSRSYPVAPYNRPSCNRPPCSLTPASERAAAGGSS
jgi:hypothetical protein